MSYFSSPKTGASTTTTRKSFFDSGGDTGLDSANIDTQITNAEKRIADAGYVKADADRRNWFEKATNLPQGQNWLFDTLELIGRPGNAVKNVIDKTLTKGTEGLGEAVYKGLSGQDKVSGAKLAENMGIDNKVGKFVVGLGLDIGLDPTTYIPGGVIAKGLKGTAGLAAEPIKAGYNALESASPAVKAFRESQLAPAAESFKDGLGYMFKRDYKIDETLNGGKSMFLKDLNQQTENSRQFMQEQTLETVGKAARGAGGIESGVDVGRLVEAPLKQLDEAGNPLPRPERQLSSDPKIQQSAQDLMDSNATVRQFAKDNGIDINELEGYMTHVWSKEERALRKKGRVVNVDQGRFGTGNPNKKILNQRELMGSAEDVNDQVGRKFFEPNAFYASAIGQKRLIDYAHSVNFRRKVLSNPDFATKYDKGMVIPKGAEVIDTNNYKFLKDSGDSLDGLNLADEVGGQYVVTRQAKQLLDRYQRLNTDEGTKAFLKFFDTIQSFWKRGALFSLGYHVRNQAGAMFNNYVGGMNPVDLAKYTQSGFREVARAVGGKESKMFTEYRQQGLSSTSLSQVEFARFGEEPEKAIEKTVKNLSKDTKGQVTQRLNPLNAFETSREVGNFFDQANRFALYKWARDNGMSAEQAAAKVREVQFDYSKLSMFESNVVARVLPFYRWMRNNIPFQIRQFVNDPRKYAYLNKARLNAQDVVGLNEDNIPDYMKEQFSIPISGDNGKGKMLGLNLPLGDLTKLSRPGKTLVDAFTPLIKTPAELALNYNMFRGKPIQEFEGQKKQYVGGAEIPIKAAYALEQATGQIGRGLSGMLQKPESVNQDNVNRLPSLGISSLAKDFDAEKYAYYEKLNQLKQMQDLMRFIEQQSGEKPRTINEIKKGAN